MKGSLYQRQLKAEGHKDCCATNTFSIILKEKFLKIQNYFQYKVEFFKWR